MIVQRFLRWKDSANVERRQAAASALARAFLQSEMGFEERCAAEAALTLLLDDPSPKVRMALAEALATSHHAPVEVVTALAGDQSEIAALVIGRSPLLSDADLIDRIGVSRDRVQVAIASRAIVSPTVAGAIAATAGRDGCVAMLRNPGAAVLRAHVWRIIERFGGDGDVRGALLARDDLTPSQRHCLMRHVRDALAASPLLAATAGRAQAERIAAEAAERALIHFTNTSLHDDADDLIGRLRTSGDMTTQLLVRALCHGKIDFLAHALTDLSGLRPDRVRAILIDGRDMAMQALFRRAGLAASIHPVFVRGIHIWRKVANGRLKAGPQEVTRLILQALTPAVAPARPHANDDLVALLRSIYLDTMRENARAHARALSVEEPDFDAAFEEALTAEIEAA